MRNLLLALAVTAPISVLADPVVWEVNGHRYELVRDPNITWFEARDSAEAMGGYLATLTSAAENDFVVRYLLGLDDKSPYWLGGFQDEFAEEPGGNWQWVTGESWDWTNWANLEPNNLTNRDEDGLAFAFWGDASIGEWNDAPLGWSGYSNGGFIVEYTVPEPGTLLLFGLGLLGMGVFQRGRNS